MGLFGSNWSDSRVKELYKTATNGDRPMDIRREAVLSLGNIARNMEDDASDEAAEALGKIMDNGDKPKELRKKAAEVLGSEPSE